MQPIATFAILKKSLNPLSTSLNATSHTQSRALAVRPELVDESDPERERDGDLEYDRSRLRPIMIQWKKRNRFDLEQATKTSQTWYNTQVHSKNNKTFFFPEEQTKKTNK